MSLVLKSNSGRFRVSVGLKENGDMTYCPVFQIGLLVNWQIFMKKIGQNPMAGFELTPGYEKPLQSSVHREWC
jgi:hypothetical protein